ncbi:hypothetical protein AGLY_010427 [Aphis glycines]|uniref:ISXO2-like transposase domain-containing protein n=1 Tax=Aphis glycines TaxID=307491 RepID=A0A6G0TEF4_APHGL|nr:hypothetical protein AGLY_010427 [Aphis glycines]
MPNKRMSKMAIYTFSKSIFTYVDKNGKNKSGLSLYEIIELVWCWVNKFKVAQTEKITGRGHHTVSNWFNLCRDVVAEQFNKRGKMGGKELIVQIDESIFQRKRKYNRGRLRLGDCKPVDNEDTDGNTTDSSEDNSNEENQNDQNKNYGSRVQGPWVFGMCCLREDEILERRFYIVNKRDRDTLLPIIIQEIEPGSTVHSDEWRAYGTLKNYGFLHQTVNHSKNFIDPHTGAQTQTIECETPKDQLQYKITWCNKTTQKAITRRMVAFSQSNQYFQKFFERHKKYIFINLL